MLRLFGLALLVGLLLTACTPGVVPPPKSAEFYLQEGDELFESELYEEAIASWEKMRDSYASPEMTELAELKIAEAYFLSKKYPEAAAAYEDFLKQHPNHPNTPAILLQLGKAYFRQVLSADRDQTATRNAKITLENLQERFADSEPAQQAQPLIDQCRDRLAAHELYVGRFYLRTGHPQAAIGRLSALLEDYPDYRARRDEVYYQLGKAQLRAGDRQAAADAFNALYREFPGSKFILKGQRLLEQEF